MNGARNAGFTLVEMLVVVGIVAILMALGAPTYRTITTSNRVASEINGLLSDMKFARSEAIKRGQIATVCSSANGTSCSGSSTWNTGWLVWADLNGNGTVDNGEPVLRVQPAFAIADSLVADNNISAVPFNREGFALNLPGTVTLALHDPSNKSFYTRCLAFSIVGTMTIQKAATGNCT